MSSAAQMSDYVDSLLGRINAHTSERQELRGRGADRESLEQNRLEIVRLQWELSRALIARHCPDLGEREAA